MFHIFVFVFFKDFYKTVRIGYVFQDLDVIVFSLHEDSSEVKDVTDESSFFYEHLGDLIEIKNLCIISDKELSRDECDM